MWHGPLEVWYDADTGNADKTWAHVSHGTTTTRIENTTDAEYSLLSTMQHALATLDASGDFTTTFSYAPFGELLSKPGDTENHPKRFNNKYFDDTSQLYYYGYRYYDQLALIWTQADPLYRYAPDLAADEPRRSNLYTFTLNSPLSGIDPDGQDAK